MTGVQFSMSLPIHFHLSPDNYHDVFFREAAARVFTGKEAELIRALGNVPEFDLYCFRSLLESIPESWKARLAIPVALACGSIVAGTAWR